MADTTGAAHRPAARVWSRRPFVGVLPKTFRSPLALAEVTRRLSGLTDGPRTIGAADGDVAWFRSRGGPPLPATTLRVIIAEDGSGARIQCRFDPSRWDGIDLWVYTGAMAIGFVVSGSWLSGHMPLAAREKITAAAPAFIGALAVVALAHYGFRRWRQAVRDRLFDQVMAALGVPIE